MTPLQNFRLARYRTDPNRALNDYHAALRRLDAAGRVRSCVPKNGVYSGGRSTAKTARSTPSVPIPTSSRRRRLQGAQQLRSYGDVPRPFVIDPLDTRGEYRKGESFSFQLTLIGRAIDYLPYFLVSFRELGEMGIGKGRGRFQLTHVRTDEGESIYDGDTQMVHNLNNARSFDDIQRETESQPTEELTLRLITPARITHEGELTDQLPFHVFWRRLIGRISALAYFHCGESLEMDFKGLIEKAMTVETTKTTLRWKDWTRYSSRQDRKMQLGGLVGSVTYAGDLAEFIPFVMLGNVSACRQERDVWVGEVSG